MSSVAFYEIVETIRHRFGLRVDEALPINRGYLNEKWMLHTNRGTWFAKCFHPQRYDKYGDAVWDEIDQALRLQMAYFNTGGVCPALFENEEGGYVHPTPAGRKFVLTAWSPGVNVAPGQASERQMFTLGMAAARMHHSWNVDNGAAMTPAAPVWSLHWDDIRKNWQERWETGNAASSGIRESLLLQKEVMDRFDPSSMQTGRAGWAHLDLWTENLLFSSDGLSAIVDFDRVRYSYPSLDIGRAILSCTLNAGDFRRDAAAAFAEGYRTVLPLSEDALLHAVRYSWLIESNWWIRPPAASWSTAPRRFQQEMIWTAAQWDRLEEALGNL